MIVFNPPVVKSYAPATQPIAKVSVGIMFDENMKRLVPRLTLLDPSGGNVVIDAKSLPQTDITPAQLDAFSSAPTVAGQTLAQDLSSRALPILATCYGLVGGVVQ
jgi:hypothetical protein